MTEVISIPADSNAHFGSPLQRTSSSTTYLLQTPHSYTRSTSNLRSRYAAVGYDTSKLPASEPSSAPSSPRLTAPGFSSQPSFTSTPSSSFSLDEQCGNLGQDHVLFSNFNDADLLVELREPDPSPSPDLSASPVPSPSLETITPLANLREDSTPLHPPGDDSAIADAPTRHVDYLSHNWKEEDIWASWRHIVAKRNDYSNSSRLENASWRTWAKAKYHLKTVSPETLNWMKDHDVTWLYGPLQTGKAKSLDPEPTQLPSKFLRSNSFGSKKPILKKRSLSELMLQHSLSSSTLMKQATDAIRAQVSQDSGPRRQLFCEQGPSDFVPSSDLDSPLRHVNTDRSSTDPSTSSSGIQTPCTKRHIHFNNRVEQCIAINEDCEEHSHCSNAIQDESDSEDDLLIMKPVKTPTKAKPSQPNSPRGSFGSESKTIAMLPSTTLNYRGDTPEPRENGNRYDEGKRRSGLQLASSSSQQTLRPSTPSTNFLLDDDEDDADMNWQPSSARRGSCYPREDPECVNDDSAEALEGSGLRRTPSGMFMPYDEEDEYASTGLLGKVVDTVNTAKDIAHVIWNVGWRR